MNWYEWVFSGVGVFGLGYLLQLWVRSGQQNKAKLTAKGAKVTHSPVANGSGITQTISETHHHHYTPAAPEAAAAPRPAPRPSPANEPGRPRPNLAIIDGR